MSSSSSAEVASCSYLVVVRSECLCVTKKLAQPAKHNVCTYVCSSCSITMCTWVGNGMYNKKIESLLIYSACQTPIAKQQYIQKEIYGTGGHTCTTYCYTVTIFYNLIYTSFSRKLTLPFFSEFFFFRQTFQQQIINGKQQIIVLRRPHKARYYYTVRFFGFAQCHYVILKYKIYGNKSDWL